MKNNLIILFILSVFVLIPKHIKADDSFQFSSSVNDFFDSGNLFVQNKNSNSIFFVKQNFLESNQVVYKWNSFIRDYSNFLTIENFSIKSAKLFKNKLYFVGYSNDSLYCGRISESNDKYIITKIPSFLSGSRIERIRWIGQSSNSNIFVLINFTLFKIEESDGNFNIISLGSNIIDAKIIDNATPNEEICTLTQNNEAGFLNFSDTYNRINYSLRIQLLDETDLHISDKIIFVVNSSNYQKQSLIHIIDCEKRMIVSSQWIETSNKYVCPDNSGNLYFLKFINGAFKISVLKSINTEYKITESTDSYSFGFVDPMGIEYFNNKFYVIFKNGIGLFDNSMKIIAEDYINVSEYFTELNSIAFFENKLLLSSNTGTLLVNFEENKFWIINVIYKNFGKYLIYFIIISIMIIIFQAYRHQKRILNGILELPSAGFVAVTDRAGRITRLNEYAKSILNITDKIPLRKNYKYYDKNENISEIFALIEQALKKRDTIKGKINVSINGNSQEWFCTIVALRNIAGAFRGILLTGLDITEQLERKRLTNWAQLAHDMQTNLSTIRLNAEHLEVEESDNNKSRRKKIIHQVNILMQRIRDIVTVGRSDKPDLANVSSFEICEEVRMEFDEVVFPNVEFELACDNFVLQCDKPKIIRALRNSVENGIRALQGNKGKIIIKTWKDARYNYFSVKDTGIGMDEETKIKFLKPYFTTAKNSGGFGIGTMIMQHVAELHGGKLLVNSEKGKGTEIIYQLPIQIPDRFNR